MLFEIFLKHMSPAIRTLIGAGGSNTLAKDQNYSAPRGPFVIMYYILQETKLLALISRPREPGLPTQGNHTHRFFEPQADPLVARAPEDVF